MSYPDKPTIETSYTASERAQENSTFPGMELDVDFANLANSVEQTIDFLRGFVRADGSLSNGVVTRESLASDITLGFGAPSVWATGVDYVLNATVFNGASFYICTLAHTSGDFDDDLASGRWALLFSLDGLDPLLAANNLSDVDSAPAALVNLEITANAGELNVLDGITASTSELNILDGVTATSADLNTLVGAAAKSARTFATVALMLANTTLTYAGSTDQTVLVGDEVYASVAPARDGIFAYRVLDSGTTVEGDVLQTAGGVKLQPLPIGGTTFTPEQFGAANTGLSGDGDDAAAVSAAMWAACTNGTSKAPVELKTCGRYYINSTVGPSVADPALEGGRLIWNSVDTTFECNNVTAAVLRKVSENPAGTTSALDSDKGVILDTRGMFRSTHSGNLHIRVVVPTAMNIAGQSAIPVDVVGIAASSGTSARQIWERVRFSGVYHPFWQGDQSGTGGKNLSYTGWYIKFLEEFMCGPIICGTGGNNLDDVTFENWTRFRGFGRTIIRVTTFRCDSFFNNGKNQNISNTSAGSFDTEDATVTATTGSTTITLSEPLDMPNNMPVVIQGGDMNLAGDIATSGTAPDATDAIWFVAYIASKTTSLEYELDRPVPRGVVGAALITDAADILLETSDCIIHEHYAEEIHTCPMRVRNRGYVKCNLRQSEGYISGEGSAGMLLVPSVDARADIKLHNRSSDNPNLRYNVGVASLRNSTTDVRNSVKAVVESGYSRANVTRCRPVGIIEARGSDLVSGYVEASEEHNPKLVLISDYTDQTVYQKTYGTGEDAFSRGHSDITEYRTEFTIDDVSTTSGSISKSSGTLVKAGTGNGYARFDVVPNRRYEFYVNFDPFTGSEPTLRAFNDTTELDLRIPITRDGGRYRVIFDAPSDADHVRLQGFSTTTWTATEAGLREVIDV